MEGMRGESEGGEGGQVQKSLITERRRGSDSELESKKIRHYLFLSFLLGITPGVFLYTSPLLAVLAFAFAIYFVLRFFHNKNVLKIQFVIFILAGIVLGFIRTEIWQTKVIFEPTECLGANVLGEVKGRSIIGEYNIIARIKVLSHTCKENFASNLLELRVPHGVTLGRGDIVKVFGDIKVPEDFTTDTGAYFDYSNYLLSKNISHKMTVDKIETKEVGTQLLRKTDAWSKNMLSNIHRMLKNPEGGLAGGILLGDKRGIDGELEEDMKKTGLIHIAVLSGYNISLASEYARKLFSSLGRNIGIFGGFVSIIFYGFLAGFEAPVLRAIVMAGIALVGLSFGRTYVAMKALLLAGSVFALFSPASVLFDPSFHLSFLATFGVIALTPIIESKISNFVSFKPMRDIIAVTLSAYICVTPYIAFSMGTISLVAPLANLLVAPLIPIAMLASFGTLIVSYLGKISLFVAPFLELPITLIVKVANTFSIFEWSSLTVNISELFVITFYIFVLLYIIEWYRKNAPDERTKLADIFEDDITKKDH